MQTTSQEKQNVEEPGFRIYTENPGFRTESFSMYCNRILKSENPQRASMAFIVYLVKAAEDALQIGRFAADPGIFDPKFDALR